MPAAKIEVRINPAAPAQIDRAALELLIKRARRVQRNARRMAPGKMGRKINAVVVGKHVRVESSHPATMYVIKGTRPHQIRPRTRQVLKFTTKRGTVFARVVNHPGTKPNDFLTKALRMG
ncbi:hypothetical protein ACH4F6_37815 [Streptomyces sp. NPDC017936]|uniref:hypothetical protein n=1 Tax=Streptomyces sp. NPDC017936 TaxID=3365016 RepID=UPI0037992BEC